MTSRTDPATPVVVLGQIPPSHIERLREHVDVQEITHTELHGEVGRRALATAQGLLVTGQAKVDAALLDAAPALRVISLRAVGYDAVDVAECTRRGVMVCNTPGVLDNAVAELTMLLILAVARGLPGQLMGSGEGPAAPGRLGLDLKGRTLGIVGLGRIGRRVAEMAGAGLRMNVLYTARSPRPSPLGEQVDLDRLLEQSDVVSLHVPLTEQTRDFIGHRQLSQMKRGAILINASRGGLVDETALVDALREGHLAGAGLDVTNREPLPLDDPLRAAPNIVLTPHIGSATHETRDAMAAMAVSNLLLALAGDQPLAVVRPAAQ
jgi:glyoxylate reductase